MLNFINQRISPSSSLLEAVAPALRADHTLKVTGALLFGASKLSTKLVSTPPTIPMHLGSFSDFSHKHFVTYS
ncbi:MAG: hypothetical protein L0Z68_10775, partial [Gammaproteobacteria bacterium]|nr:hypothetical protein [Gammaproteobacteria bacterium]